MIELLTGVTNAVFFPAFSRIQHDPERTRRAFYHITQYTSLISFPLFIGAALVAPELVVVVFGPQWAQSIPVMQVLAFIGILHSIFYFNNSVVIAAGKPAWRLVMSLINAISNVLGFTLAVHWGIVAVAAAYVIRGYFVSPVEVWMLRKVIHIDLKIYMGQYLGPALGSLIMAMAVVLLRYFFGPLLSLPAQLVLYVLSGSLVYLTVIQWVVPSFWRQLTDIFLLLIPGWARNSAYAARLRK
jgi:PST family polysaccharide transporter